MIERDIGRHDEAIDTLKDEVAALRKDIAEIKEILASAKGSWKTLVAVGGVAGAIGAALFKLVTFLKGGV